MDDGDVIHGQHVSVGARGRRVAGDRRIICHVQIHNGSRHFVVRSGMGSWDVVVVETELGISPGIYPVNLKMPL